MADESTPKKKRKTRSRKKNTNPSTEAKEAIKAEEKKQAEEAAAKEAEEKAKAEEEAKKEAEAEKAKAEEEKAAKEAKEKKAKKSTKANKIKLPEVDKIKVMLEDYKACAPVGIATPAIRERKVKKLVKIVTFISNNTNKEVLNAVYDFFKKERSGLMAEQFVLQGTSTLNASTREKVELLYGALVLTLSNATAKKKIRPNIELLTKRFGDGVASWFAAKNK